MRGCAVGQVICGVVLGGLALALAGGCAASSMTSHEPPDAGLTAPQTQPANAPAIAQPAAPAAEQVALASNPLPLQAVELSAKPVAPDPSERLTMEQVATWTQQGTRDDIIIDRIERAQIIFRVSAADEQMLRQQGVSDDVICALKETTRR